MEKLAIIVGLAKPDSLRPPNGLDVVQRAREVLTYLMIVDIVGGVYM